MLLFLPILFHRICMPIPGAVEFINGLKEKGFHFCFLRTIASAPAEMLANQQTFPDTVDGIGPWYLRCDQMLLSL